MNAAEAHAAAAAAGLALLRADNSTGFKGVFRQGRGQPFRARLIQGGRENHLGSFATAEECREERQRRKRKRAIDVDAFEVKVEMEVKPEPAL